MMKYFFQISGLFLLIVVVLGCPRRPQPVIIAGAAVVNGQHDTAKLIWHRASNSAILTVTRTGVQKHFLKYNFPFKISDLKVEKTELTPGEYAFLYHAEILHFGKRYRVDILEKAYKSTKGWPCSHSDDELMVSVLIPGDKMFFMGQQFVAREHNPFNPIRYKYHHCP